MNMFEESSAPPDAQSYRQANDGAASTPKTEPKYTATRSGRNLVVCIDGTANQFSKRVLVYDPVVLYMFDSPSCVEHPRRRAVQPPAKGRRPIDILQQRHRDLRQEDEPLRSLEADCSARLGHGIRIVR